MDSMLFVPSPTVLDRDQKENPNTVVVGPQKHRHL
jgi:hypothetical protein